MLGLERVGRHDHFFEIGGHSLLVIKVLNRIRREMKVELSLNDVYESPKLSSLAERIVGAQLDEFDREDLRAFMLSEQDA